MEINLHLIFHNISTIISALILLGVSLFSYLSDRKNTINITFSVAMLATATFMISHLIGANLYNAEISRFAFMFNLSIFFIGSFLVHSIIYTVNKEKEYKWLIIFLHSTAMFFVIFFSIFPDLFLLPSVPKMYFPNYYEPGSLNIIRLIFLDAICAPLLWYLLLKAYKTEEVVIKKKQYLYFLISLMMGLLQGFITNLLVYDIQVDPLIGILFPVFFIVPFIYGAVKYELLNIKIIARQAFFYALSIIIVGAVIILLIYSNGLIYHFYPDYPGWITALVASILVVTISTIVWRHLREVDLLKYEFISTVTHKFRTPLTGIKWATENLNNVGLDADGLEQLRYIKSSTEKLVELTNLLVTTSETEHNSYQYKFTKNDITDAVKEVMISISDQVQAKHFKIEENLEESLIANCDVTRIKFVIQTLIENAIHYTKNDGVLSLNLFKNNKEIIFAVHDTGMGISKEESALIFSKFYRTSEARVADTEGMGIGLFISKEIINRHKGKILAESKGLEKGSTFSFSLPLAK